MTWRTKIWSAPTCTRLWLAETEQYLGDSLTEILDVEGISPSLELKAGPKSSLTKKTALVAARDKAQAILDTLSR